MLSLLLDYFGKRRRAEARWCVCGHHDISRLKSSEYQRQSRTDCCWIQQKWRSPFGDGGEASATSTPSTGFNNGPPLISIPATTDATATRRRGVPVSVSRAIPTGKLGPGSEPRVPMSPYAAFGAPLAPYNSVPLHYVAAIQHALQSAAASAQISTLTSLAHQTEVGTPGASPGCTPTILPATATSVPHHASPYSIEGLLYNNNKGTYRHIHTSDGVLATWANRQRPVRH